MTMVPASKLSKPHLIFYGGCGGGSEVMSRFGDGGGGGGYNDINGNNASSTTTATDNIITNTTTAASIIGAKHDDDDNDNVIRCVLGSDLGIGHPNNNNIIGMAEDDEQLQHQQQQQQQQRQQQSRHSNNSSVNNDDDGGDIRQPVTSIKMADTYMIDSSSWLQLGLGGGGGGGSGTHLDTPLQPLQQPESTAARSGGLMLELNLGGGGGGQQTTPFLMPEIEPRVVPQPPHEGGSVISGGSTATFISPHHHHHHQLLISSLSQQQSQLYFLQQQQQQQIGWGFVNQRTALSTSAVAAGCCSSSMSPSSSSSLQPPVFLPVQGGVAPFLTRPFNPSGLSVDPDSEFRLIHPPPRRPHSGIWFALHASLHQSKEPFLPQLPKNFLRIKDGRMTVRLVMKYVANKLGLDCESEVEIRCRGQQLVPYLTLQHVRDNIWSPREAVTVTLLPDSSTSDHVMVLNYGRSTSSSAYFSY